jgi:hypothetical protein
MPVAPNGRKIILMSDAGGTNSVSDVTLTFDDAAANYLPDESALTTGTYKPTDYGLDRDSFPSPAPADHALGTTLSTFVGGQVFIRSSFENWAASSPSVRCECMVERAA